MTDTNTTPTPATPAVNPTRDFINNIIDQFSIHIEGLVERKVNEIMEAHATMMLIDSKTEEKLREIAQDMLNEHESDNDHFSRDDLSDEVSSQIVNTDFTDQVKQTVHEIISDGDYCTEERATELAQDAINDIDWEDKVKEGLRGMCE